MIEREPNNLKAYYRRGNTYFIMGFLDEAKNDLKKAYELDNSNLEVVALLKKIIVKQSETNKG